MKQQFVFAFVQSKIRTAGQSLNKR